tara:strand:+ start:1252 stop:1413 length:162 start_codon:yes stop_codon:yes gene_type:complete
MDNIMTDKKIVVWINLFIGLYNLWLYSMEWNLFNLIIGSLNIGVWVFFRGIDD